MHRKCKVIFEEYWSSQYTILMFEDGFLWSEPVLGQGSKITKIMVHQKELVSTCWSQIHLTGPLMHHKLRDLGS